MGISHPSPYIRASFTGYTTSTFPSTLPGTLLFFNPCWLLLTPLRPSLVALLFPGFFQFSNESFVAPHFPSFVSIIEISLYFMPSSSDRKVKCHTPTKGKGKSRSKRKRIVIDNSSSKDLEHENPTPDTEGRRRTNRLSSKGSLEKKMKSHNVSNSKEDDARGKDGVVLFRLAGGEDIKVSMQGIYEGIFGPLLVFGMLFLSRNLWAKLTLWTLMRL